MHNMCMCIHMHMHVHVCMHMHMQCACTCTCTCSVHAHAGVFVQCHIAPGSNMSYPADCLAANVPPSGVVVVTVPRAEITTTKADNWCPWKKNYTLTLT